METFSLKTEKLLSWYAKNVRLLPWRADVSAYHVWLSEIMLQQTRAETVIPYYERFLKALPDIESLAAAPEDRLYKLWEGLGYYSRIRNMHSAARRVMEDYGGELPQTRMELNKLSGIGNYTSAAIASIAFGEAEPAVDGNLLRVFARMTAYPGEIKTEDARQKAGAFFRPLMDERALSDNGRAILNIIAAKWNQTPNLAGTVNQALMDLGAMVCLPNAEPICGQCPWAEECEARRRQKQTEYPVKSASKPRSIENRTVLVILYGDKLALGKRPCRGLLAGLYEFPSRKGTLSEREAIVFAKELGFSPLHIKTLPCAKHIFTHKEWHMTGYEIRADELTPFLAMKSNAQNQNIILASRQDIREHYSIPSAFSAYTSLYL